MSDKPLKITGRIPCGPSKNGRVFTPQALEQAVEKLNERAESGACFGQIEAPYDGKTRLDLVSHRVLPGAKLREDGSIEAQIEVLDTPMGNQLRAMLEHSHKRLTFSVRGFGCAPDQISITSVDVNMSFPKDWTVLDGICDALENEEKGI